MNSEQFHDIHQRIKSALADAGLKLTEFRVEHIEALDKPNVRVVVQPEDSERKADRVDTIRHVREFHAAFRVPAPARPCIPKADRKLPEYVGTLLTAARDTLRQCAETGDRCALRLALETEELLELYYALISGDLEAALDAKVDQRYVSDGTVIELGLADVFDEAFERVHGANMRKLGPDGEPVVNASGKVVKPKGWEPPVLHDLVK